MTKPRYQDVQGDKIPEVELGPGARARVLVGTVNGVKGPVMKVATETGLLRSAPRAERDLHGGAARGHNAFAYVYQGDAKIGAAGTAIARGELALLTHGASLPVTAGDAGRAADRRRGSAAERAGRALRPVRHEHSRRDPPGVRRLPGRAAVTTSVPSRSRPWAASSRARGRSGRSASGSWSRGSRSSAT